MSAARNGKKFQDFVTNQYFYINRLLTLLGHYVCFQKKKKRKKERKKERKSNEKIIKKKQTSHNQTTTTKKNNDNNIKKNYCCRLFLIQNIAKFFRAPILKNICKRLLLKMFMKLRKV